MKAKKSKLKRKKYCRHKWSEWRYEGSFEDGYTRVCTVCRKVQVK